jgi:PilZ domain-containing protein
MRSAEITKIIHPYENGQPVVRDPERRSDPRWSYPVTQLVAFHEEDQRPTKEILQAVQCRDISSGGMSFLLANPPPSKHCTVLLGRPPNLICVKARIVNCEVQGDSQAEWRIGCQFIEKAEMSLG